MDLKSTGSFNSFWCLSEEGELEPCRRPGCPYLCCGTMPVGHPAVDACYPQVPSFHRLFLLKNKNKKNNVSKFSEDNPVFLLFYLVSMADLV